MIQAVKNSYNPYAVDSIAESLATAAVIDTSYYDGINAEISQTRDWFSDELSALGFEVLKSKTNFILMKPRGVSAKALFEFLQAKKIYVRYFGDHGRLSDYLRISIGTRAEMTKVVAVIGDVF